MHTFSLLPLLGFIAACFVAALGGAVFRPAEWYEHLAKPSWRPPNRLFAPVWTVLYFTIAVSGWLVWRKMGFAGAVLPLSVYAVQLVLNAAWSPIFFGLRRPDLGFLDIVLIWLSIVTTISAFLLYSRGSSRAALSLPCMGQLCSSAQLRHLASQFVGVDARLTRRLPSGESELLFDLGEPVCCLIQRVGVSKGAGPSVTRRSVVFIAIT
jgi:translocator protein